MLVGCLVIGGRGGVGVGGRQALEWKEGGVM